MPLCRIVRAILVAALVTFATPAQAQWPASTQAQDEGRLSDTRQAQALEPLRLRIEQIEAALRRSDLTDDSLIEHRGSIDPVRDELRDIIDTLDRRLEGIDLRLKQIGEAPAVGAPPEEPGLAAERSRLQERRVALDGTLKQTRLLVLRADNLSERITERRRSLFTRQLLNRTASAASPSFWAEMGRVVPDTWRRLVMLGESWRHFVHSSASGWTVTFAAIALLSFFVGAFAFLRWFGRQPIPVKEGGTRFAKSLYALLILLQIALTAPAIVMLAVLILDAFGLLPPPIVSLASGLAIATAIASFGRGVAIGLFAPNYPARRLLVMPDTTAKLVASHLIWSARILSAIVFINILQKVVVAPVTLTIASSAIFAAAIAALLSHFLFRLGRLATAEDEVSSAAWLRAFGWILAFAIIVALLSGFIGLAAFLAGRFLAAMGAIGALYVLLSFIDTLFAEVLTASTPRGRAAAHFFGIKPRSIELIGTLLSAAIRLLLIFVVLLPLLGPWGIFAADFLSVVRDMASGIRIGGITISLTTVLGAFAILLIGVLATRAVQGWLKARFLPRTALDPSLQNSLTTIFGYLGVIAAVSLALAQLGVDFQKITLVAGALSIGIGFGLQSVVSNFVSGLILLAERPIRVGDIISVKGEEGRVRRIHVRATEIETGDRASVIIPNSELITQVVKNRTHTDTFARVAVPVSVAYDSDAAKVRDVLMQIAKEHPQVMESPAPTVFITGFGENALNFELGWVVRNIGDGPAVKSDICFAILERFRAEGIVIPHPQRTIHIEGLAGDELAEPDPAPKKPKGR